MSAKEVAAAAKAKGNKAWKSGDYKTAVNFYTEAIGHDPTQHAFYSNRSACFILLKQYDKALADGVKCTEVNPRWAKGFGRKGTALFHLGQYEESKAAFEAGLKIDPNNAGCRDGLADVQRKLSQRSNPMAQLFGPSMIPKLAANPQTAPLLNDPNFMQKINLLRTNPNMLGGLMQDPQISLAMQVLLGLPANFAQQAQQARGPSPEQQRREKEAAEKAAAEKKRKEEEEKKRKEQEALNAMTAEEKEAKANKERAVAKKTEGNGHYGKKRFDQAIACYEEAVKLDPTNPVFLTNIAAAQSAKKDYDSSIATCRRALQVARDVKYQDFKFSAKCWLRIGNAYLMKKEYEKAIEAYNSSLLEARLDGAEQNKAKAQKRLKRKRDREYLDPEKALEAKNRGNAMYREGKWPEAIAEYTDAIKRDPKNHVFYSNRANCYSKLMSWSAALADCEKCIKLNPTFTKIYIRKGKIQHFLKNYKGALDSYSKGLEIEPSSTELLQARQLTYMKIQEANRSGKVDAERQKEAMKDPEIQAILMDPVVRNVLDNMRPGGDRASAQAALRNPDIRNKLAKLEAAGIVRMG